MLVYRVSLEAVRHFRHGGHVGGVADRARTLRASWEELGGPNLSPKRYLPMEHNGIEYSVVQTISPAGWRWSVRIPGRKPKTGVFNNRQMAVNAAKAAIEKTIRVKPEKKQTTQ